MRSPRSLLFSRLNKPSFLSLSSQGEVLQPTDHLFGHPLDPLQQFPVLYWELHTCMQYCRWGLTRAEQRGTITSLSLLATPLLMEPTF